MATPQRISSGNPSLFAWLHEARANTDALFRLLSPNSFYDRPIPERHRLIFYLGHLEAFDWNLLSPMLELRPANASFDQLFAFGIDPVGGGLPTDEPKDWPHIAQVESYNRNARQKLDEALEAVDTRGRAHQGREFATRLHVAIEHRLMHAETLAYLFHNVAERKLFRPQDLPDSAGSPPEQRKIEIPRGFATLGQKRGKTEGFGWDNEFEEQRIEVPEFSIDEFPVTNADFLAFIRAGGYEERSYWSDQDWHWKESQGIAYPHLWRRKGGTSPLGKGASWMYRSMFGAIPLPLSWPVYVSYAEASAYAAWAKSKLPTEAQWHRAAYGVKDGSEREYPWGFAAPDQTKGNFDFKSWNPSSVDAHPTGASAFEVQDMLGNGWEWTSTVFAPFPGFEPFAFYRGYSANFFDGKHVVMKGGSARTGASMLRRPFRNWFQANYPYVYATFRCVEN